MKSSRAKFNSYPKINNEPSIIESSSALIEALDLELESHPISLTKTMYSPPAANQSIWELGADLPQSVTTTTNQL